MSDGYTMPRRKSAHILSDVPQISKDAILLAEGMLANATVLGQKTDKSYVQLSLSDSGEAIEAKAVLFGDVDASVAPVQCAAHVRVTAVLEELLIWPDGITEDQKAQAIEELSKQHIVAR